MKIAICDDSTIDREVVSDCLHQYFTEHSVPYTVHSYESGSQLYYDIQDGAYFDLLFLDIYMNEVHGMDIARNLRKLNYTGKIVFLTSTAEFAVDSYEVQASGYLLKPHDYRKLCDLLDRIVDKTNVGVFAVSVRNMVYSIPYNEIVYVESQNNICILHRSDGTNYTVYKKLCEIEQQLNDSRFLRSHRSYLVNMSYIAEVDKQFVLTTGDAVLIRQRSLKEIRTVYQGFAARRIEV